MIPFQPRSWYGLGVIQKLPCPGYLEPGFVAPNLMYNTLQVQFAHWNVANSWFFGLGKKDQIALRIVILAFCSFRWKINRETHRFDMGCAGLKQSYAGSCVWWYDLQSVSSSLWIENLDTILWASISLLSLSSWTSTRCIVVAVATKQKSPRKRHPWLGCRLGAWQSW